MKNWDDVAQAKPNALYLSDKQNPIPSHPTTSAHPPVCFIGVLRPKPHQTHKPAND